MGAMGLGGNFVSTHLYARLIFKYGAVIPTAAGLVSALLLSLHTDRPSVGVSSLLANFFPPWLSSSHHRSLCLCPPSLALEPALARLTALLHS